MTPYVFGALVPLLITLLVKKAKHEKKRGLLVDVGGEHGYVIRNSRFPSPITSAWEGIATLAELFENACKQHPEKFLLGTRKLVSRELEVSEDGRTLEKLHLGEYEWLTYAQAFEAVCNFASGLAHIGHTKQERVAIFADTREEWFLALQVFISSTCILIVILIIFSFVLPLLF